jgi:hypothetical protein
MYLVGHKQLCWHKEIVQNMAALYAWFIALARRCLFGFEFEQLRPLAAACGCSEGGETEWYTFDIDANGARFFSLPLFHPELQSIFEIPHLHRRHGLGHEQ